METIVVDLTDVNQDDLDGLEVVGKFHRSAESLDYNGVIGRVGHIVEKISAPDKITFLIHGCWQSFVIVQAVSAYFKITPQVFVCGKLGELIRVSEFYDGSIISKIKGGDGTKLVVGPSLTGEENNKLQGVQI